ncbi:hypothetical protein YC2023_098208 [Brassica napus]
MISTALASRIDPVCVRVDTGRDKMFGFLSVNEGDNNQIVEFVNVKLGCFYEPLTTKYSGLHRYKMGDILQVTGFYNSAPEFKFAQRKNMVISIQLEATTDDDISKALTQATCVLESSDLNVDGIHIFARYLHRSRSLL